MAKSVPQDIQKVIDRTLGLKSRYPDIRATSIFRAHYYNSTGFIQRCEHSQKRELLGYCSEEPMEVLSVLFPRFHVTGYLGFDFYSTEDRANAPMDGIIIGVERSNGKYGINPVVDGKLSEMLELFEEDFSKIKRKKLLSDSEKLAIVRNISSQMYSGDSNNQLRASSLKNGKEAIDVLTGGNGESSLRRQSSQQSYCRLL